MPLLDFNDSTANQFAVQSQRSLRTVSIHRGFAKLCDSTETPRRLHCELFAVESQSKSPKCESGIKRSSQERQVWDSNFGPVKSDTVLLKDRHRNDISSNEAVLLGRNVAEMGPSNLQHASG